MSTSVNAATSKHPRVIDSTSPEKRDEQVRNLPGDKCPHCNQVCTIESKAIQCDLCSNWVHAQCEGIPYSKKLWRGKNFGEFGESQQFANFFCQFSCFAIWGARRNVSCDLIVSRKDQGKDIDIAVF